MHVSAGLRANISKFSILSLLFINHLISAPAFSAEKAKPDLPIGEESLAAPQGEEKDPHAKAPAAAAPQGEEKDPHAKAPAAATPQGEEKDPHAKAPAEHGGEKNLHQTSEPEKSSGKLLEGKVAPATPAHGQGFIWFAVVFVILAVAIFIFT